MQAALLKGKVKQFGDVYFVNVSLKSSFSCPQACFWAALTQACSHTLHWETCIDVWPTLHNAQTHRSTAVGARAHQNATHIFTAN